MICLRNGHSWLAAARSADKIISPDLMFYAMTNFAKAVALALGGMDIVMSTRFAWSGGRSEAQLDETTRLADPDSRARLRMRPRSALGSAPSQTRVMGQSVWSV